ncbi:hypothetical protein AMTRI_Chr07g24140 [Amborella trichopoda]
MSLISLFLNSMHMLPISLSLSTIIDMMGCETTLGALLNSIARFIHLVACQTMKYEPIQKDFRNIANLLKLLKTVLDEALDFDKHSEEALLRVLEDLDVLVNEAREFLESWHPKKSKLCTVIQSELMLVKIQKSSLEICNMQETYLQSCLIPSHMTHIQHCRQELKCLEYERRTEAIEAALRDQKENLIPHSECLVNIMESLNLTSNQELLIESVALERERMKIESGKKKGAEDFINQIIILLAHMRECLFNIKQSENEDGMPPSYFCCPLSLELMSDPVIVASGQTFERAFIQKWLDEGMDICPKTRQTLNHTNLIPNYTVKALISNWCEVNNKRLQDPIKPIISDKALAYSVSPSSKVKDCRFPGYTNNKINGHMPESNEFVGLEKISLVGGFDGFSLRDLASKHSHEVDTGSRKQAVDALLRSFGEIDVKFEDKTVLQGTCHQVTLDKVASKDSHSPEQSTDHSRNESISSAVSSVDYMHGSGEGEIVEVSRVSSKCYSIEIFGEEGSDNHATQTGRYSGLSEINHQKDRDLGFSLKLFPGSRNPNHWTLQSENNSHVTQPDRNLSFSSSLSHGSRDPSLWNPESENKNLMNPSTVGSTMGNQVRKLVESLGSQSSQVQKEAAAELRLLAKHEMENRVLIAECGAIPPLVSLLRSQDEKTQENAVTALLNLSINEKNKRLIVDSGAIDSLIEVLNSGTPEAKENSAATLFSLSVIEEYKVKIGRSGAIQSLVELLNSGTLRGKKDAATALFNLSIFHENKARIVKAGAVKCLIWLMDLTGGMVDKSVAVLSNLATIPEGRSAIAEEGGIPALVEVVELGSQRGKENAASTLLLLCMNSNRYCSLVLQEGAVPPLVALSQSGTPRAKEKAQQLLSHFRNQREGNVVKGQLS